MTINGDLIKIFREVEIDYIFGVPGGAWIPYLEEIRKNNIKFITTVNEASAGFMADVVSRFTNKPAGCYATFGAGATNLTTGVGCAFLDRNPMLAFTSEYSGEMKKRITQMNINHQELFKSITKKTITLTKENYRNEIIDSYELALSPLYGPVHIGIPDDFSNINASISNTSLTKKNADKENPNYYLVEKAINKLKDSKNPVLAFGLNSLRVFSEIQIKNLINNLGCPVVITPMARGVISQEHKNFAGVLFHSGSDKLIELIKDCDLLITVGYDPVEFNIESWINPIDIIDINDVDLDVSKLYPKIHLNMEKDVFLNEILTETFSFIDNYSVLRNIKMEFNDLFSADYGSFGPIEVLSILKNNINSDAILTCDVGAHTHLLGQFWDTGRKDSLIMTNGWSSMGFGIPSAIAAKIVNPDRQVVSICGDGGFLMMCGELILAKRLNLPIIFIVLADKDLSLIKVKQLNKNFQPDSVNIYSGKFLNSKRFLDIPVINVSTSEEMLVAVKDSVKLNQPVIIEAEIDGGVYQNLIAKKYK